MLRKMYCYGNELAAIFESKFVQNFFHRIVFDLAYFVTFSQIFFFHGITGKLIKYVAREATL